MTFRFPKKKSLLCGNCLLVSEEDKEEEFHHDIPEATSADDLPSSASCDASKPSSAMIG
ncbi:unnamed protein product [Musa textilis]